MLQPSHYSFWKVLALSLLVGCGTASGSEKESDIALSPEELNQKTADHIRQALSILDEGQQPWTDSVVVFDANLLNEFYRNGQYAGIWSQGGQWQPVTDSLFTFLQNARLKGLFPEDYHFTALDSIRRAMATDSLSKNARRDAVQWAKADLLLTDAFFHSIHDLRIGRLPSDSLSARKDSTLPASFYLQRLSATRGNQQLSLALHGLEPLHPEYQSLISALPGFIQHMNKRAYTPVPSPKSGDGFRQALQTRLYEAGYLTQDSVAADSLVLAAAVRQFQTDEHLAVDGKAGEGTVRALNMTDDERFVRIAITLDKFKHLPDTMPSRYVWVNIAGYNMRLREGDSIKLESKIICGKPITRTPQLTSAISELITYPQWTVPTSIIAKEILPAVKKDPGYLAKKGFSLVDKEGNEVDPFTVDWTKYSKGIPYKVVQGSGDDNALGILKFNFPNKYAVYLHDTNQRYLFARDTRSLSHGCVRVQAWDKLAQSIIRYDYPLKADGKPSATEDSLQSWLKQKVKKHITVKNRLPVYIRYLTCEARGGKIIFHDDIYGEDKNLQARYFARR